MAGFSGSTYGALKNGINGINEVKKIIFDDIYPVGMIIVANIAPLVGTWEDITSSYAGRYLRIGEAGELTAEALPKPTITIDDNGEHTHTSTVSADGSHSHTASTNSTGSHTHTVSGSRTTGYYVPSGSYYGKDETSTQTTSSAGSHSHTVTIDINGTHIHTIENTTDGLHTHNVNFDGDVYVEGGAIQPLGYGVKVWKRTA